MLYEIFATLFIISNILLILVVVMQKNHGGFWAGPASGDSTILFGGNQGATLFQKISWILGFFLMFGCLSLSVYRARLSQVSTFYNPELVKKEIQKTELAKQKEDKSLLDKTDNNSIKKNEDENLSDQKISDVDVIESETDTIKK